MITIIKGGRLLDCVGASPLENASIIVEGGTIKEVCQSEVPTPRDATVINAGGKTVMPGLIDAHDHLAVTTNDMGAMFFDPPLYTALRLKAQLEKILQAGFTTVRDGGGGHWSLKQAVEDGLIAGPRLLLSGAMLSVTGGHGDFNVHGEMTYPPDPRMFNLMRLCDGEDDCRKAVREQFRKGAEHIKICVTGGCASPNDQPWMVNFTEREIKAMVEEAESLGSYVMGHCLNDAGIRRAVDCGVKTIEHGAFLSDETALLMKEKGVSLVATPAVVVWAIEKGKREGAAEWFIRKLENPGCSPDGASLMEGLVRAGASALKAGLPIGSGADFFGTMCGGEAANIKWVKELFGITPYQALKAATSVNAKIVRLQDKTGTIEPAKWADLIVVDGNPDEDINVITVPEKVRVVMKQGQILKNTLNS